MSIINEELNMIDQVKNQIRAIKKLAQYHKEAGTPKRYFCQQVTKQKKKIRLTHLKKKRERNPEDENEAEEEYVDLFKLDYEGGQVYLQRSVRQARNQSCVQSNNICPGAIMKLTQMELENTEKQITIEELSKYQKKQRLSR